MNLAFLDHSWLVCLHVSEHLAELRAVQVLKNGMYVLQKIWHYKLKIVLYTEPKTKNIREKKSWIFCILSTF